MKAQDYNVWRSMIRRCYDSDAGNYKNYGGRGISVCDRWRASFRDFVGDLGPRPGSKYTLERINNNGNYEPSNCRWATRAEQNRNMRTSVFLTHDGITLCLTDWGKRLSFSRKIIARRLRDGWTDAQALGFERPPAGSRPEPRPGKRGQGTANKNAYTRRLHTVRDSDVIVARFDMDMLVSDFKVRERLY